MLSFRDYWDEILACGGSQDIAKAITLVWQMWVYRNSIVFGGEQPNQDRMRLLIERQFIYQAQKAIQDSSSQSSRENQVISTDAI